MMLPKNKKYNKYQPNLGLLWNVIKINGVIK